MKHYDLDILFLSIPVLTLQNPPVSTAVLSACVKEAGYTSKCFDANVLLRDMCKTSEVFDKISYKFEEVSTNSYSEDLIECLFAEPEQILYDWLSAVVSHIKQENPKWVGLSVFSYLSHKACLLLSMTIRKEFPYIKIVIGGRGANSFAFGPEYLTFNPLFSKLINDDTNDVIGNCLLQTGFIDSFIDGDAEQEIIDLLQNEDARLTGSTENINLDTIPFCDYDDFDLTKYEYINNTPQLSITGSKGCVRKCTFCDIPVLWPKYKFRSGEHIASEMIALKKRYNVNSFFLTDSLVNGSLVAFRDFTKAIAKYNNENPTDKLRWAGQHITRPIHQIPADYYDLIEQSGGEGLTIGVESGSDNVREHMKKKFKSVDIDHELEQFYKKNISCVLLFFSCYPTETWQDFVDTAEMIIRYQKYYASGTVYKITLGIPYVHLQNTGLHVMQDDIKMRTEGSSDVLWLLEDNPELTFYERVRRRLILQEIAFALNIPLSRTSAEINQIRFTLIYKSERIRNFFGPPKKIPVYPDVFNITQFDNLLMPLELQRRVYSHLQANPTYNKQIDLLHSSSYNDIESDSEAIENYLKLKQELGK